MKLLLDTHAYLWFIAGSEALSSLARQAIESPENTKYVSVASLWEITVKHSLGKLTLEPGLARVLGEYVSDNGFAVLPIATGHLLELSRLPFHHRDPFDRLIIAQCRDEQAAVCSADRAFGDYDIDVVW